MQDIIIYGIGDFAKLMLHYFKTDSSYNVVGFCVDKEYLKYDEFCELPLICLSEMVFVYPPNKYKIFIAIGYLNMRDRILMYEKIKVMRYKCVNYISSKAIVDSSVTIGENNVILENTVIEPFVNLENNNIIWSSCNICHNTKIQSHCFIAAQSLIGGFSQIKRNCFLGFNSTILQNIILEDETLVGAKTLINKNTEKFTNYCGVPGKKISKHENIGIRIN